MHECLLEDQEVVDEESELLKFDSKNKIGSFMEGYEEITTKRRHCNDKGKLDGSMKAHCRRVFIHFDTIMRGKYERNYFEIEQCK